MNDNLKRLKPREKPDLHPRLFRQLLDPFKSVHYMNKAISSRSSGRCIGHFFDNASRRAVLIDLGPVWVYCRDSYRAMPSSVEGSAARACTVESDTDQPFEGEGIASYQSFSDEHRPQRSEDGAEAENSPGPYVIPGQSLTGETNHQFEWSEIKCAEELC